MKARTVELQKKVTAIVAVVYLLIIVLLAFKHANYGLQNGVYIDAASRAKEIGLYQHKQLPGDSYFVSGMQGQLLWRAESLSQVLILDVMTNKSIDMLDVLMIIVFSGVIIYIFKDSREGGLFSKSMSKGFLILIFLLAFSDMLCDMLRLLLCTKYLPYLTQGKFVGINSGGSLPIINVVYCLLMSLLMIPQKGLDMQKEAELTI